MAVKELLAADDFGTDSEDSVLLMLACWLEAHKVEEGQDEGVPAATRAELCGQVRLHRLSSTYLHHVLPEPFSCMSRVELGFVLWFVGARHKDRKELLPLDPQHELSPWYCSSAQQQVVPEQGRTMEWSISTEHLVKGLRRMVRGKVG